MEGLTISGLETMSGVDSSLLAGRYRVVRPLGQGGMGSVWLAEDTVLDGLEVAIKMLPSVLPQNRRAYQQLKSEALVAIKLSHSSIASVRSFEENNGNPFIVEAYIEGITLDAYLAEKGGTLSEEETLALLKPIADALDYAHAKGIVHRDVKPANVIIDKTGHPFVLDFGIAREAQETMTMVTGKLSSGTLLYMSPEQLKGSAPTAAQDVYSFATMVYECLTGRPPFYRGQVEYQIVNEQPEPLSPKFSNRESIMAGLAKDPAARPATCAAVLSPGSSVSSPGGTRSRASVTPEGTRVGVHSRILLVLGSVMLGLFAAGGWFAYSQYQVKEREAAALKARIAEERRRQQEAEAAAREKAKKAEEAARKEAEARRAAEEKAKKAEEAARKEAEAKKAEEAAREEAEARRAAEEKAKKAEEAARKEAEARRAAEEKAKKAEETARKELEARRAAEAKAKKAEERRKTEETARTLESAISEKVQAKDQTAGVKVDVNVIVNASVNKPNPSDAQGVNLYQANGATVKQTTKPPIDCDIGHLTAGTEKRMDLGNGVTLELIWCPPGTFTMGSPPSEFGHNRNEMQSIQSIPRGFWLGKYEVTQAQWYSVMGTNPSRQTENDGCLPVANVTLADCQQFVAALNRKLGGGGFRLPSSAEWEYACRAGTTTSYAVPESQIVCLSRKPERVGARSPNPWGFHDMHGNLGEWTPDVVHGRNFFQRTGVAIRGGFWKDKAVNCRSASIRRENPAKASPYYGFRVCYDSIR